MSAHIVTSPLDALTGARCSDGAPSARNLLVTVFGDTVRLAGDAAEATVHGLAELLAGFDVNERLVRTSLSRIAADGLVTSRSEGRRSYYRIADESLDLFRTADQRIYRGVTEAWDGSWTIVVVDGNEATPAARAELRQQLTWLGLGTVAPNVMASPVVLPDAVAEIVARVGGFDHVLVSRSRLVDGDGLLGVAALARRSFDLGEVEQRYRDFIDRFAIYDAATLRSLDDALAFKLRTLIVSTFRRIALADPQLPNELLPADWIGKGARSESARLYAAVAAASDRFIERVTHLEVTTPPDRFTD
jgi:phenylacetic acid degradation operon negative regulatory protein